MDSIRHAFQLGGRYAYEYAIMFSLSVTELKYSSTQTGVLFRTACLLSGVPDFFDRIKILSGGDLSHYQVPHCIRVFFYFVWFVFIHHNFQFFY